MPRTAAARLDRQVVIAVRDAGAFRLTADVEAIVAKAGDKVTIPLRVARDWPACQGAVEVHAVNMPPALFALPPVQVAGDEGQMTLLVRGTTPPGVYPLQLVGKAQPFPHGKPDAATK